MRLPWPIYYKDLTEPIGDRILFVTKNTEKKREI
jgi:hypothetical protein